MNSVTLLDVETLTGYVCVFDTNLWALVIKCYYQPGCCNLSSQSVFCWYALHNCPWFSRICCLDDNWLLISQLSRSFCFGHAWMIYTKVTVRVVCCFVSMLCLTNTSSKVSVAWQWHKGHSPWLTNVPVCCHVTGRWFGWHHVSHRKQIAMVVPSVDYSNAHWLLD